MTEAEIESTLSARLDELNTKLVELRALEEEHGRVTAALAIIRGEDKPKKRGRPKQSAKQKTYTAEAQLERRVIVFIDDHPGTTELALRLQLGVSDSAVIALLEKLVRKGSIDVVVKPESGLAHYYPAGSNDVK